MGWYYSFRPYVSVAERRAKALRETAKLAKKGRVISPVKLDGKKIAHTFWGKGWCDHMESFSDYSNRLPRGRTYVRNGSVVDLQISAGQITALVMGSELYTVKIDITPLSQKIWKTVKSQCAGQIASLVELLQGRMSKSVMEVVTRQNEGLFPKPAEIKMDCSCPDWAGMCKHVAAVMYGVGARLDEQPELLFTLRQVDHLDLIAQAADPATLDANAGRDRKTIAAEALGDVFGIDLDAPTSRSTSSVVPVSVRRARKVRRRAPDALPGKKDKITDKPSPRARAVKSKAVKVKSKLMSK